MSFDAQITALIAALNANTAALTGNAAVDAPTATADKPAATTKTTKTTKTTAPKGPSREEVVALLTKIKDERGAAEAKPLIEAAGVKKMAEIPDDKLKSVFEAATALLAGGADDSSDDDGDL